MKSDAKITLEIDEASYNIVRNRILALHNLAANVEDDAKFEAIRGKLLRLENLIWFLVASHIVLLFCALAVMFSLFGE